jgi:hypothetical protein
VIGSRSTSSERAAPYPGRPIAVSHTRAPGLSPFSKNQAVAGTACGCCFGSASPRNQREARVDSCSRPFRTQRTKLADGVYHRTLPPWDHTTAAGYPASVMSRTAEEVREVSDAAAIDWIASKEGSTRSASTVLPHCRTTNQRTVEDCLCLSLISAYGHLCSIYMGEAIPQHPCH